MFLDLGSPPKGPPPPYAQWQMRHIKVVERAIAAAWTTAMGTTRGMALLASATEPEITAMLQDALTTLLNSGLVHGYSPAVFGAPIRGQEIDDYSGEFLEKRPDLTFPRLSSRPTINHNALFYECKILGRGRSLDAYVNDGVSRFQKGNYAWAMPHAGMIAYVGDMSHEPNPKIALAARWEGSKLDPYAATKPVGEDKAVPPFVAISEHARAFTLRNGIPAGDITLRHIWLIGSSASSLEEDQAKSAA
jgi:hypothetical protein